MNRNSNTRFGISKTLARPQLREISSVLLDLRHRRAPDAGQPGSQAHEDPGTRICASRPFHTERSAGLQLLLQALHRPDRRTSSSRAATQASTTTRTRRGGFDQPRARSAQNLGLLTPTLQGFTLIGNVTLADSRVDLGDEAGTATEPVAPDVVPVAVRAEFLRRLRAEASGTNLRVLYWTQGPRITRVSSTGGPRRRTQMPRHLVDVTASQKLGKAFELKLTIQNLLSSDVVFGAEGAREYRQISADDGTSTYQYVGSGPGDVPLRSGHALPTFRSVHVLKRPPPKLFRGPVLTRAPFIQLASGRGFLNAPTYAASSSGKPLGWHRGARSWGGTGGLDGQLQKSGIGSTLLSSSPPPRGSSRCC